MTWNGWIGYFEKQFFCIFLIKKGTFMVQEWLDGLDYGEEQPYEEAFYQPLFTVTLSIDDGMGGSTTHHTKYFNDLEKALHFARNPHSADDLSDWEEDCFSNIGAETCSTFIKVWIDEDVNENKINLPVCIWQRNVWA
jgi:hypothetical protein